LFFAFNRFSGQRCVGSPEGFVDFDASMNSEDLRRRTMQSALRVISFFRLLPTQADAQVIGRQLLRSATSAAANYRAAGRSRSRAEFISKLSIVVEEADETLFWLEMILEAKISTDKELSYLLQEAKELVYIFSASRKSSRENQRRPKTSNR
jgi:four helix bundle protein